MSVIGRAMKYGFSLSQGWRPLKFVTLLLVLVLIQDIIVIILEHGQFATSVVCTDPKFQKQAGPFLTLHCLEHKALGDFTKLSTWLSAATGIHWQRLVAVAAALLCF